MKKECINAINSKVGRELNEGELNAIEDGLRTAYKTLQRKDPAAFATMNKQERYVQAAQIAKDRMVESRVNAHVRSVKNQEKVNRFLEEAKSVPSDKVIGYFQKKLDQLEPDQKSKHTNILSQINDFDPTFFKNFQDREKAWKIIQVLKKEADYPEFKKNAEALQLATDVVHQRLNDAGIKTNYNERFTIPQNLEDLLIGRHTESEYVKDMMGRLHPDVFLNIDGTPKTEKQKAEIIIKNRNKILSDGVLNEKEKVYSGRRSAFDSSRNMEREFYYKDTESLKFIMEKYGRYADAHGALMNYISRAAKDISLAEKYGTDPKGTFTEAVKGALYEARKTPEGLPYFTGEKVKENHDRLIEIFKSFVDVTAPDKKAYARFGRNLRGLMSLTTVGNPFAALPDLAVMGSSFGIHNLPFIRGIKDVFKNIGNGEESKLLRQNLGIAMDEMAHHNERYVADVIKPSLIDRLNVLNHLWNGLRNVDLGLVSASKSAIFNTIGAVSRTHAKVEDAMGENSIIKEAGFNQTHYDLLRASELATGPNGDRSFMSYENILKVPDHQVGKILEDNRASSDPIYATEIKKMKQKVLDYLDKNDVAHMDFQGFAQGIKDRVEAYALELENKTGPDIEIRQAKSELLLAQLDALNNEHSLQQKIIKDKQNSELIEAVHDIETAQGKSNISEKLTDVTSKYSDEVIKKAAAYVENKNKIQSRIAALKNKIEGISKEVDKRVDAFSAKGDKNIKKANEDLQQKLAKHENQMLRLKEYISEFQKQRRTATVDDVRKFKNETVERLLSVANYFSHQMARGAAGPNISEKYQLGLTQRGGAVPTELTKLIMQFKQIPFGVLRAHIKNMEGLEGVTKAKYLARAAGYGLVTGAASTQISALLKGEDPKNMDPRTYEGRMFLMESMIRGGVLGLYGDILFNTGRDLAGAAGGPAINFLSKLYSARANVAKEHFGEKPPSESNALTFWKILGRLVPFANIWYVKGAYNHMVFNSIADWIQPGYSAKQEAKSEKRGTSYYWPPSKALPQRLPDLSTAIKGSSQ